MHICRYHILFYSLVFHRNCIAQNLVDLAVHNQSFYLPTIFILVDLLCKAANPSLFFLSTYFWQQFTTVLLYDISCIVWHNSDRENLWQIYSSTLNVYSGKLWRIIQLMNLCCPITISWDSCRLFYALTQHQYKPAPAWKRLSARP